MSLAAAIADPDRHRRAAADAVREASAAVRARTGARGLAAQIGLQSIERLRPGFLERQVHHLLPGWALAVDPFWQRGCAAGDGPGELTAHADDVAAALLAVSDEHVAGADDRTAVEVYERLRPTAARRIADEMPRIATYVARWADPATERC